MYQAVIFETYQQYKAINPTPLKTLISQAPKGE